MPEDPTPSPTPAPEPSPAPSPAPILPEPTPSPTPATGFANEKGEFTEGWLGRIEGLSPESQAGLMKFKDLPAFVKSHVELEKTLGAKGNMVTIPGADAKPEVVAAYRKALGIPEDPKEYNFKPDALPDGVTWDDTLMDGYKTIAMKHNIPPAAMKELAVAQAQMEAQRGTAAAQQLEQRDTDQKAELGKSWGTADFEKNSLRVKAAATLVGFDPKNFSTAAEIVAFNRLASMISDDTLKIGEAASTFQNGEGLAKAIMTDKNNPDHAAYQDPQNPSHKAVRAKVHDLLRVAGAGVQRQ